MARSAQTLRGSHLGEGPELVGPDPSDDSPPGDDGLVVGPNGDPDRYRLVHVVASGGEGTLWKASIRVDSVDLPVAVKVMHPRNQADLDEWRVRWQGQTEVLRSLSHPTWSGLERCSRGLSHTPLAPRQRPSGPFTS